MSLSDKNRFVANMSAALPKGLWMMLVSTFMAFCLGACGKMESSEEKCREMNDSIERAYDNNNLLAMSDMLRDARELSFKSNAKREYFRTLNLMTILYTCLSNYEEALSVNDESRQVAEQCLDSIALLKSLNNRGAILCEMNRYEESYEVFNHVHYIAKSLGDSSMMSVASKNMCAVNKELGKFEDAMACLDHAERESGSRNSVKSHDLGLMRARLYYLLGEKGKGDSICKKITATTSLRTSRAPYVESLRMRAIEEAQAGHKEHALRLLDSTAVNPDQIARYLRYRDYARVCDLSGDFSTASVYKDSALQMMDSIHEYTQNKLFNSSSAQFTLLKNRNMEKVMSLRIKFLVAVCLLVAVIAASVVTFLVKKKNNDRKLSAMKDELMEARLEASKTKNDELEKELEKSRRELSASQLSLSAKDSSVKAAMDYISQSDTERKHQSMLIDLKNIISRNENIDKFISYFNNINPEVLLSLQKSHPDLNQNDMKYLTLVYSQLSTNEIALVLGISTDASKKRKQRISQKLGLSNSSELYTYILNR